MFFTDFVESPVATHAAQEFLMSIDPPKQEALAAYVFDFFSGFYACVVISSFHI
jgi:hypothetical protein